MGLAAVIAADETIEEVDDRRKPFGLEKHEAPKFRDGRFFSLGEETARDDQDRNVAEFWNLTEIFQHVETRKAIREAHIEHCCDDRRRSQQLDRPVNRFCLDARVPRTFQESTRGMPDERLIVQDEDGGCDRRVGIWMHVAAYVR